MFTCLNANISQGMILYRELKKTTDLIRQVYGGLTLAVYVLIVSYFAATAHIFLGYKGEAEKVIMICIFSSGVMWILAAEFHHSV